MLVPLEPPKRDVTFDFRKAADVSEWLSGPGQYVLRIENEIVNLPQIWEPVNKAIGLCYRKAELCTKIIEGLKKGKEKNEYEPGEKGLEQRIRLYEEKKKKYIKFHNALKQLRGMVGEM